MCTKSDWLPRRALVVLAAAAAIGAGIVLAQRPPSAAPPAGADNSQDYWTPERMRKARPLMPVVPGRPVSSPDGTPQANPPGPPQGAPGGKPLSENGTSSQGQAQGSPNPPKR
jgi:hypothetical protein